MLGKQLTTLCIRAFQSGAPGMLISKMGLEVCLKSLGNLGTQGTPTYLGCTWLLKEPKNLRGSEKTRTLQIRKSKKALSWVKQTPPKEFGSTRYLKSTESTKMVFFNLR